MRQGIGEVPWDMKQHHTLAAVVSAGVTCSATYHVPWRRVLQLYISNTQAGCSEAELLRAKCLMQYIVKILQELVFRLTTDVFHY